MFQVPARFSHTHLLFRRLTAGSLGTRQLHFETKLKVYILVGPLYRADIVKTCNHITHSHGRNATFALFIRLSRGLMILIKVTE